MVCKEFLKLCLAVLAAVILTACGQEEELVTFTSSGDAVEDMVTEIAVTECVSQASQDATDNQELITGTSQPTGDSHKEESAEAKIFVHVCGAVITPGVYEISEDARVFDAIKMAGGCREDASADSLNLAQSLTDGQRIYVPTKEEVAKGLWQGQQTTKTDGTGEETVTLVNINTAGKEELMTLPGIGEAKAESILSYRQENGSFGTIEEIKQISGIKDSVFEKIKNRITV